MKNDSLISARLIAFALSPILLGTTRAQIDYPLNLTGSAQMAVVGDVESFQGTPDGARVVYIADQDEDSVNELYSVKTGGGATVKLNGALVNAGDVADFAISPDSSRVVYRADQDADSVSELYSVPAGGGAAVKLSGAMTPGGNVNKFFISPDSTRVVYYADQDVDGVIELYSVPITGGLVVKLNGPLVANGEVFNFSNSPISPDSSRVVYVADQQTDGVDELYSAPIAGGGPVVKLSGVLVAGGDVSPTSTSFSISPDSNYVVFHADAVTDEVFELWGVPIAGGTVTNLSGSLVAGGDVFNTFRISSDSGWIVFGADKDQDGVIELYSVKSSGGSLGKLNPAYLPDQNLSGFAISADGSRVVYTADQDTDSVVELYSVFIDGGGDVKLNGPLVAGGDVATSGGFQISPDSSRVVYLASQDTASKFEIYSVPLGGGTAVKLNDPIGLNFDVVGFELSPDSNQVAYEISQTNPAVEDVFLVPIGGGTTTQINNPLPSGGKIVSFEFSADGAAALYYADQETDDVFELFSSPVSGGSAVKLNGQLAIAGGVSGNPPPKFSPDGNWVVFTADLDQSDKEQLYSVPSGGGAVVRLNNPLPLDSSNNFAFQITPDSSRVIYMVDQDEAFVTEIYSVPIGGGAVVKLNPPTLSSSSVASGFQISPDGSRVVFRVAVEPGNGIELFSVSPEGDNLVKLNPPPVANGSVFHSLISPDSASVVYVATQVNGGVFELFRAPINGGAVSNRSGTLVAGGNVLFSPNELAISPDSARIVFIADRETDNEFELYSVGMNSGSPVKVHGTPMVDGFVLRFAIAPGSQRVVYHANYDSISDFEIYSASIDGSGTPIKLNSPLVAGGDSASSAISPDGTRVVYLADQDTDDVLELYSVAIGGGAPIKLSGPMVTGGDVDGRPQITPDSSRVVYSADQDFDSLVEIYSVPIGGGAAQKLNPPLPANRPLLDGFQVSPDGAYAYYLSDLEIETIDQLYRVPIGGGPSMKINDDPVQGGKLLGGFILSTDGRQILYRGDQDVDNLIDLFVWKEQARWNGGAGDWFTSGNWEDAILPSAQVEAVVGVAGTVRLPASATPARAETLWLGGGSGLSILELRDGAGLSLTSGLELAANGVLRGDGFLDQGSEPLPIALGAEIRAGEDEILVVSSGAVTNSGRVAALGNSFQPAEVEFFAPVTNSAGTGVIIGHDSILRFNQGITNDGSLIFGSGINDVFGDVLNGSPGGIVVVSGGALTIFNDDVTNNAVINVSAAGSVESAAVFFGALTGNGVSGGGDVFIEGDARPGFSPGTMAFGGDVSFGPLAKLKIEIGGIDPGIDHDKVTAAGHLALGGSVEVALIGGYVPTLGTVFDVIDAGTVSGSFTSVTLPALPTGRFWHADKLETTGELAIGLVPPSYAEFAALYGLTTGPGDDEDFDGRMNLLEYLQASIPVLNDSAVGGPDLERVGTGDEFSFTMAQPGGSDLIVEVQVSTTLIDSGPGGWTTIATRTGIGPWTGSAPVGISPAGDGLVEIVVENSNNNVLRRFYRLRAQLLP